MHAFPETLQAYRTFKGLSQSALARKAGYDHSFISRLEKGERSPSRNSVLDVSSALELSPEEHRDLLASAGFSLLSEPLRPELVALNAALANATPEALSQVLAIVETLTKMTARP